MFLIDSNLFISLCSASLYYFYSLKSQTHFHTSTISLVFFTTYLGYHLLRIIPVIKKLHNDEIIKIYYTKKNSLNLICLACTVVLSLYGMTRLSTFSTLLFCFAGILVILYERSISNKYSLRAFPYLKPFIIAIVWAITSTCLNGDFQILKFIDCFVFITLLSIPFDIKDLKLDNKQGIRTIPMLVKKRLPTVLSVFYLLYAIIIFITTNELYLLLSVPLYYGLFKFAARNKKWYYLGFDGLIILRLVFYLLQNKYWN